MTAISVISFVTLLVIFLGSEVISYAFDHHYISGDTVPIYANKLHPYNNPGLAHSLQTFTFDKPCMFMSFPLIILDIVYSETYNYYDFPFCSQGTSFLNVFVILLWTRCEFSVLTYVVYLIADAKVHAHKMLNGNNLVLTPYKIEFLVDKQFELLCKKTLSKTDVSKFRAVIKSDYRMQMYHEDMPISAFVGRVEMDHREKIIKTEYFLYNHYEFHFFKGTVIEFLLHVHSLYMVNVTDDVEADVEFTYSVKWLVTQQAYDKKMDMFTDYSSVSPDNDVLGYSIANTCLTIFILIICILVFYIRVLRKDISRYAYDVEEADNQEEPGLKKIHGDVLRFPKHKSLFAAALGSGTQLLVLMVAILMLGATYVYQLYLPGVFISALAIIYALTSAVSGYTSTLVYYQLEGTRLIKNGLLTGGLYFGPSFLTFIVNNTVAVLYGSTAAMPLGEIIKFTLLWLFLALPLLILGSVIGKNSVSDFQAPCRTTKCPKKIPKLRWYRRVFPQMALAGLLSFSVIIIQIHDILDAVWSYKIYTSYVSRLIILFLVLIMTALVSVVTTYFQLAAEDHEWWWRSFFCCGSTGLYVYGYSIYYSLYLTEMNGFVEFALLFGYMACFGYGIFLALGTVGFYASLLFIRYLYSSIKCD
ncbi:transmembrane 9 superfamily member 4-like [Bidens hawaiensis]|uniref:transmembrane 9 superfamily member 4-like n=1 Tax=Bidens hawaiensis TaxID=980011 RepID=UPI00404ADDD5